MALRRAVHVPAADVGGPAAVRLADRGRTGRRRAGTPHPAARHQQHVRAGPGAGQALCRNRAGRGGDARAGGRARDGGDRAGLAAGQAQAHVLVGRHGAGRRGQIRRARRPDVRDPAAGSAGRDPGFPGGPSRRVSAAGNRRAGVDDGIGGSGAQGQRGKGDRALRPGRRGARCAAGRSGRGRPPVAGGHPGARRAAAGRVSRPAAGRRFRRQPQRQYRLRAGAGMERRAVLRALQPRGIRGPQGRARRPMTAAPPAARAAGGTVRIRSGTGYPAACRNAGRFSRIHCVSPLTAMPRRALKVSASGQATPRPCANTARYLRMASPGSAASCRASSGTLQAWRRSSMPSSRATVSASSP